LKRLVWLAAATAFLTATAAFPETSVEQSLVAAFLDDQATRLAPTETTGTPWDSPFEGEDVAFQITARRRPRPGRTEHGADDCLRTRGGNEAVPTNGRFTFEPVTLRQVDHDGTLAAAWDQQVQTAWNLYAMYHSREWLSGTTNGKSAIALIQRDQSSDNSPGIAPLSFATIPLRFQVRGLRFDFNFDCVELLGGQSLGAVSHEYYVALVDAIWRQYPEVQGIYFKSVPDDSPLWRILTEHDWRLGQTVAYRPEGDRAFHYLALPSSFEGYLGEFRKKRRYNLKRQLRVLSEAFPGSLAVRCVMEPSGLAFLDQSVRQVAAKSWKSKPESAAEIKELPGNLAEIAKRGLLRSYVMTVDHQPCAYIVGYQFNGIFHYADIGYDEDLAEYSPGNVLLLMVIKDLIETSDAKFVNFGITDAEYKRVFGNRHIHDASLLLLRPGLVNDTKRRLHMGFQATKAMARKLQHSTRSVLKST
jgi:hypothetical protein